MFDLFWVPNFIKIRHIEILGPNLPKYLILGQDPEFQISFQISFMINEFDLLWVPNFIAFWMYFIFATTSSWNEGINTCFTVECVLLGRNFDFLGGYLVVIALYLIVTGGYWWLLLVTAGYCWLLFVTARYCSFPLLVWTKIHSLTLNVFRLNVFATNFARNRYFLNSRENMPFALLVRLNSSYHPEILLPTFAIPSRHVQNC